MKKSHTYTLRARRDTQSMLTIAVTVAFLLALFISFTIIISRLTELDKVFFFLALVFVLSFVGVVVIDWARPARPTLKYNETNFALFFEDLKADGIKLDIGEDLRLADFLEDKTPTSPSTTINIKGFKKHKNYNFTTDIKPDGFGATVTITATSTKEEPPANLLRNII